VTEAVNLERVERSIHDERIPFEEIEDHCEPSSLELNGIIMTWRASSRGPISCGTTMSEQSDTDDPASRRRRSLKRRRRRARRPRRLRPRNRRRRPWGSSSRCRRQGLTLVHFSAQPELFWSLKSPNVSNKKCSRQAEKWTIVSPWSEEEVKTMRAAAGAPPEGAAVGRCRLTLGSPRLGSALEAKI